METKEKYQLELPIGTSAPLLYQYISTPAGLASWYADDYAQMLNFTLLDGAILKKKLRFFGKSWTTVSASTGWKTLCLIVFLR